MQNKVEIVMVICQKYKVTSHLDGFIYSFISVFNTENCFNLLQIGYILLLPKNTYESCIFILKMQYKLWISIIIIIMPKWWFLALAVAICFLMESIQKRKAPLSVFHHFLLFPLLSGTKQT